MRVRQSTLGTADNCLLQLQYELELPVYHAGSMRAAGTAYHAGLEHAYRGIVDTGEPPDLVDTLDVALKRFEDSMKLVPSHESEYSKSPSQFKWDEQVPSFEDAFDALTHMLTTYYNHDETWWPSGWEILAVEEGFSQPLWGDHTRNGSIDLVLRDPDGNICGEDHKTTGGRKWAYNKHHARKQNQAPWYVAALKQMFPGAPGYRFFYDIMTLKGDWERRESVVTDEHVAAVDSKALSVVTLYEGLRGAGLDLPANPASTLCSPKYCDWFDVCPYGAPLDVQQ